MVSDGPLRQCTRGLHGRSVRSDSRQGANLIGGRIGRSGLGRGWTRGGEVQWYTRGRGISAKGVSTLAWAEGPKEVR